MADDSAAATAGPVDISDIKGVPRGGALGPGRFLFRGQLFWQELLPEPPALARARCSRTARLGPSLARILPSFGHLWHPNRPNVNQCLPT